MFSFNFAELQAAVSYLMITEIDFNVNFKLIVLFIYSCLCIVLSPNADSTLGILSSPFSPCC